MNPTLTRWIALTALMLAPSAVGSGPNDPPPLAAPIAPRPLVPAANILQFEAKPFSVLLSPPLLDPDLAAPAPVRSGLVGGPKLLPREPTPSWLIRPDHAVWRSTLQRLDLRAVIARRDPLPAMTMLAPAKPTAWPIVKPAADPFSPWAGESNRAQRLMELLAEAALVQIEGTPIAQHDPMDRSPIQPD